MAKRAAKKKKQSTARRTRRPQKTLSDLFHETLKDIYYAENKIIKTLPKMAKAAHSKQLAAAFNKHLRETAGPGEAARSGLPHDRQAGARQALRRPSSASPMKARRS